MEEPFAGRREMPQDEARYDVRAGALAALRALRRAAGSWTLRSTWRATFGLVVWSLTSVGFALTTVGGLLAAAVTLRTNELGAGIRVRVSRQLSRLIAIDRRQAATLSGALVGPPVLDLDRALGADRATWASASLLRRLATAVLGRALVAFGAGFAAVAWWWGTLLALELSVRRLERPWHWSGRGYLTPVHLLGITSVFYWHVSPVVAILLGILGLIGVLCWPLVPRTAAQADLATIRRQAEWLLGPSTSALSREVVRLSETRAQAVSAADDERRRIERDLHDGFQPQLVNLALNLGLARSRLASDPEGARVLLDRAHEDAKRATEDLRSLVRGIHPSVLDERGLDAAFSALAAGSRVRVQIDVHLDERPPREVEGAAYFVVAEAITNVNKHSGATTATISLSEIERTLRVLVQDDGAGGAHAEPGGGLAGLADRIAGLDGSFSITSPAGGPTWIEARIPCGR